MFLELDDEFPTILSSTRRSKEGFYVRKVSLNTLYTIHWEKCTVERNITLASNTAVRHSLMYFDGDLARYLSPQ